jgi:hypothetical protein
LQEFEGHPAVVVLPKSDRRLLDELPRCFTKVDPPRLVTVPALGRDEQEFYFIYCHGYRPRRG